MTDASSAPQEWLSELEADDRLALVMESSRASTTEHLRELKAFLALPQIQGLPLEKLRKLCACSAFDATEYYWVARSIADDAAHPEPSEDTVSANSHLQIMLELVADRIAITQHGPWDYGYRDYVEEVASTIEQRGANVTAHVEQVYKLAAAAEVDIRDALKAFKLHFGSEH